MPLSKIFNLQAFRQSLCRICTIPNDIDDLDADPGWIHARDRCSVALIRRLISCQNVDDLRRRFIRHIRAEQQPELSDMHIIRGQAQLDARMPMFVTAFLQEHGVKELPKRTEMLRRPVVCP